MNKDVIDHGSSVPEESDASMKPLHGCDDRQKTTAATPLESFLSNMLIPKDATPVTDKKLMLRIVADNARITSPRRSTSFGEESHHSIKSNSSHSSGTKKNASSDIGIITTPTLQKQTLKQKKQAARWESGSPMITDNVMKSPPSSSSSSSTSLTPPSSSLSRATTTSAATSMMRSIIHEQQSPSPSSSSSSSSNQNGGRQEQKTVPTVPPLSIPCTVNRVQNDRDSIHSSVTCEKRNTDAHQPPLRYQRQKLMLLRDPRIRASSSSSSSSSTSSSETPCRRSSTGSIPVDAEKANGAGDDPSQRNSSPSFPTSSSPSNNPSRRSSICGVYAGTGKSMIVVDEPLQRNKKLDIKKTATD